MVPYLKPVFHHYVPYLSFVPWIPSKFVTNLSTNRMSHQLWMQYRIYWWEPQENPRRTPREPQENLKRTSREPQENPTRNRFPNIILTWKIPPTQYLYHENPKRTPENPKSVLINFWVLLCTPVLLGFSWGSLEVLLGFSWYKYCVGGICHVKMTIGNLFLVRFSWGSLGVPLGFSWGSHQ